MSPRKSSLGGMCCSKGFKVVRACVEAGVAHGAVCRQALDPARCRQGLAAASQRWPETRARKTGTEGHRQSATLELT